MTDDIEKPDGTIDMTPTWLGVLPLFLAAIENGTDAAKTAARQELTRMAKIADRAMAEEKRRLR